MKNTLYALLTVLVLSSSAWAGKVGADLEFNAGHGRFNSWFGEDSNMNNMLEVGPNLSIETEKGLRAPFANRMDIGVHGLFMNIENDAKYESVGIVFQDTFKFRLAGDEKTRWWIGPQLGTAHFIGNSDKKVDGKRGKIELWSLHAALKTGLDIAVGNSNDFVTLALGYKKTAYTGNAKHGSSNDNFFAESEGLMLSASMFFGGGK